MLFDGNDNVQVQAVLTLIELSFETAARPELLKHHFREEIKVLLHPEVSRRMSDRFKCIKEGIDMIGFLAANCSNEILSVHDAVHLINSHSKQGFLESLFTPRRLSKALHASHTKALQSQEDEEAEHGDSTYGHRELNGLSVELKEVAAVFSDNMVKTDERLTKLEAMMLEHSKCMQVPQDVTPQCEDPELNGLKEQSWLAQLVRQEIAKALTEMGDKALPSGGINVHDEQPHQLSEANAELQTTSINGSENDQHPWAKALATQQGEVHALQQIMEELRRDIEQIRQHMHNTYLQQVKSCAEAAVAKTTTLPATRHSIPSTANCHHLSETQELTLLVANTTSSSHVLDGVKALKKEFVFHRGRSQSSTPTAPSEV